MMDGRVPRPAGDNIQLGGILYQLNGAVVRGDMIVYTASALDQEVWENILIRELYPCNNGIRRLENKEISITSDGFDMFLAAKSTAHQAQRLEQHWLQPYGGGSSFVEAYGTLYTVRTFQKAVPLDAMLCQSPIPLATALTLLNQLLEKVNEEEKQLSEMEQESVDMRLLLQGLREFTDMKELTPTIVNKLIRRIEVHNPEKKHARKSVKVDIYFTAVGLVSLPDEQEIRRMMEQMRSASQIPKQLTA